MSRKIYRAECIFRNSIMSDVECAIATYLVNDIGYQTDKANEIAEEITSLLYEGYGFKDWFATCLDDYLEVYDGEKDYEEKERP